MKLTETLGAVLGLAAFAHGHMEMKSPPPLRSKFNPNTPESLKDYSMTSPLAASGSDFPCKGYLNLLGQPAAKSVATWSPGQTVSFSLTGSANHGGGSCQASLSYDKGKTFKVVHSWVGGCPPSGDSAWSFSLPSDTPAGDALFAWTWFNQLGNREMYMNCAVITIKPGKKRAADVAFSTRPNIFVANVNNNVCTTEGKDVEFPAPGPDVTRNSSKGTLPPGTGTCTTWGGNFAPPPSSGDEEPSPSKVPGGVFITKAPVSNAPAPTTAVNEPEPATSPASSPAVATTTPTEPAVPTTPVSSPEPAPQQPAPSSSPASPQAAAMVPDLAQLLLALPVKLRVIGTVLPTEPSSRGAHLVCGRSRSPWPMERLASLA
ncbi:hypothetical protein PT974_00369 [Cladobotryum mycophilum]|uniref:Lytic polysaccharide monooxygenase n=1 Tax=Cladobotryum mycophilum TaxID=491253 RepID=A0ABR0T1V5_9HYPO